MALAELRRTSRPRMLRKSLQSSLKIAFGLGLLAWVAKDLDLVELSALFRRGDPVQLALGIGSLLVAIMYFQWTRLHVLIKGYTNSLATSLKIFYVGALFNNLLPSNIGGDAIRLVYLKNLRPDNWGAPFMLLFLYRISSFVVLVLAGLLYVMIEHDRLLVLLAQQQMLVQLRAGTWFLLLGLGVLSIAAGVFLVRRVSERLRTRVLGFVENCRAASALVSGRDATLLTFHTFAFHGFRMLSFLFLIRYFGQEVALWDLVFVVSATALIAVLPVSIAGLGVVEGSISGLLVMYGVASSSAIAVALINRAAMLLMALIGGVIYVATRGEREREAMGSKLEPSL